MVLAIILGIIMSIGHYLSQEFSKKWHKTNYYTPLLSLSAGISVSYVFISLLPKFIEGAAINRFLPISILVSFVLFHFVEKYIYQHAPEEKLLKEIALEDSAISFVYHFIVGMLVVVFLTQSTTEGILFFIPVFFYTFISTLPVDHSESRIIKIIVALSTLLGIIFMSYVYTTLTPIVMFSLIGFIIGAVSFTVFRHSIPSGKEGKPIFFIIGVIAYTALLFLI